MSYAYESCSMACGPRRVNRVSARVFRRVAGADERARTETKTPVLGWGAEVGAAGLEVKSPFRKVWAFYFGEGV
jgi:hypothetical protein